MGVNSHFVVFDHAQGIKMASKMPVICQYALSGKRRVSKAVRQWLCGRSAGRAPIGNIHYCGCHRLLECPDRPSDRTRR